jgi:hypothetical protein
MVRNARQFGSPGIAPSNALPIRKQRPTLHATSPDSKHPTMTEVKRAFDPAVDAGETKSPPSPPVLLHL